MAWKGIVEGNLIPSTFYGFIVSTPNSLYWWKLLSVPVTLHMSRNISLELAYTLQ
jgi:hypothetical protein